VEQGKLNGKAFVTEASSGPTESSGVEMVLQSSHQLRPRPGLCVSAWISYTCATSGGDKAEGSSQEGSQLCASAAPSSQPQAPQPGRGDFSYYDQCIHFAKGK
jgi:hypothetical protein